MENDSQKKKSDLRRRIQQTTWTLVPIIIVGGIFYPLFGFIVLVVMLMGMIGGIIYSPKNMVFVLSDGHMAECF